MPPAQSSRSGSPDNIVSGHGNFSRDLLELGRESVYSCNSKEINGISLHTLDIPIELELGLPYPKN